MKAGLNINSKQTANLPRLFLTVFVGMTMFLPWENGNSIAQIDVLIKSEAESIVIPFSQKARM